jgi:PAS domain S-box-containing protein
MVGNDRPPPSEAVSIWRQPALLAIAYFAVARLGLAMPVPPGYVSLVWPASGIGLAAVLLAGDAVWPGIWVGAFAANLLSFAHHEGGLALGDLVTAGAIATGNTLEALITCRLMHRCGQGSTTLEEPGTVLAFSLGGALACAQAATLGALSLLAGSRLPVNLLGFTWYAWWLGDFVGMIVVTPVILAVARYRSESKAPAGRYERWLFAILTALIVGLTLVQRPSHSPPTLYPAILCQIWAAVRLGMGWTTVVTFGLSGVLMVLTALGFGVFASYGSPEALMFLQGFVGTCAVMALVLASTAAAQRAATEALQRSGDRLQTVMDNVGALIFVKDAEGRIVMVNRRFSELFGLPKERIVGRFDRDYLPADVAEAFRLNDLAAISANRTTMFEESVPSTEGTLTFLTAKFPLRRPDGTLEGLCGVATDITERLQVNAQRQRIEALQQADMLKNQFLNILSHELRTPLTVIIGYTGILRNGMAGAITTPQDTYLGKVQTAAETMLRLVSDLLDMSRILAGRFSVLPETLATAAAVDKAVAAHWLLAQQKGLTLANAVPADTPPVRADPVRLQQVLSNLIGNAIKFTPAGGRIRLAASVRGGMVRLAVTDTGEGIPPAQQSLLFNRFSQVDMSANRRASGLGLGLSISREIVQALGGSIGVESAPGHGSTFWFTLPLAHDGQGSDEAA